MGRAWLFVSVLSLAVGCQHASHTERGLFTGGILGAGLGTVIGGLAGDPGAGAAIGAGTGLLAGGLAGSAADNAERRADARVAAAQAAAAARPPVTLAEVAQLAQQHVSDEVIIQQIRSTGSSYNLSVQDIAWLTQQGVSDRVIQEMQIRRGPPAVKVIPGRRIYVEPPPPPVSVGFGVGFGHRPHCRRRCW